MKQTEQKSQRTLLIVDDRQDVLRALRRYLADSFDAIYLAETPRDAEQVLEHESPSCLLCDYWLGETHPSTTLLIQDWRQRFPSLKSVAVMSATQALSAVTPPEVDRVFGKPPNMAEVIEFFTR